MHALLKLLKYNLTHGNTLTNGKWCNLHCENMSVVFSNLCFVALSSLCSVVWSVLCSIVHFHLKNNFIAFFKYLFRAFIVQLVGCLKAIPRFSTCNFYSYLLIFSYGRVKQISLHAGPEVGDRMFQIDSSGNTEWEARKLFAHSLIHLPLDCGIWNGLLSSSSIHWNWTATHFTFIDKFSHFGT